MIKEDLKHFRGGTESFIKQAVRIGIRSPTGGSAILIRMVLIRRKTSPFLSPWSRRNLKRIRHAR